MSIYKKIAQIQTKLMKDTFNKVNGFHGKYMNLETLLPPVINACYEHELTLYFTATTEHLILKLVSWDDKEEFSARVRLPELTKDEKKEGGNYTYMKRYLLMNTFLILADPYDPEEFDGDATKNDASSAEKQEENVVEDVITTSDLEALYTNALKKLESKGLSEDEITHSAIRKQIFKDNKFTVKSERNEIAKYCKETWGAS